jgi:putative addiction module killer protein
MEYLQGIKGGICLFITFSLEKLLDLKTFSIFAPMKAERKILAYKDYFRDFIQSLTDAEARKVFYVIDMLKTQERVNAKFVKYLREEIFELRAEQGGNIFRVFFIFDEGNVVMLFNGFQKKTQKTPEKEINKAIQLKKEYYAEKK